MANIIKTREQINRWHEGFQQLKQDWSEWLRSNAADYTTYEDAWSAFRAQQQIETRWSLLEKMVCDSLQVV